MGHLLTLVASVVGTFAVIKLLDYLHLRDANKKARETIEQADREIENRRREAELEIKELAILQRAEGEKELRRDPPGTARARAAARQAPGRAGAAGRPAPQAGEDGRKQPAQADRAGSKTRTAARKSWPSFWTLQRQTSARAQRTEPGRGHNGGCWSCSTPSCSRRPGRSSSSTNGSIAETLRGEVSRGADHRAAALRRRAYGRDHDQHGRHSQRRDEGADHRPRRPQHPGVRKGHRRGRDHRRYARRGDRQRLRHGPPRGRPACRWTS